MKYLWAFILFPIIGYFVKTSFYDNYHNRYLILNTYLRSEKLFFEFDKNLAFELSNGTLLVAGNNYVDRLNTISLILSENAKVLRDFGTAIQIDKIQSLNNNIKFVEENLGENLKKADLSNPKNVNAFKLVINEQNKNLSTLFNNTRYMLTSEIRECRDQKKFPRYSCISLKDIEDENFPFFLF